MTRTSSEIRHFTQLEHIWWGARTAVGQKRYDNKASLFNNYVNAKKGSRILEIGCGDGEFTKRIIGFGRKIVATDVTPEVIKRAKGFVKNSDVSFMIDDSEKISFRDGSFDVVCGVSILHHLDTLKALRESYRVLKKGGEIFFTEPNLLNPIIYLGLHIGLLRYIMEYSPDETALVRWEIEKMLKNIGFRYVEVRNYDFLYPHTPKFAMDTIIRLSNILEKTPLIKEISGSLLIYGIK